MADTLAPALAPGRSAPGSPMLAILQAEYRASTDMARRFLKSFSKVMLPRGSCLSKVRTDSMLEQDMPAPMLPHTVDLSELTDEEVVRIIHTNPMYKHQQRQITQIQRRLQMNWTPKENGGPTQSQGPHKPAHNKPNKSSKPSKPSSREAKYLIQQQQQQEWCLDLGLAGKNVPDVAWDASEAPELVLAPQELCELMLPTPPMKPGADGRRRTAQIFVLQEGDVRGLQDDGKGGRRISGFGMLIGDPAAAATAAAGAAVAPTTPLAGAEAPRSHAKAPSANELPPYHQRKRQEVPAKRPTPFVTIISASQPAAELHQVLEPAAGETGARQVNRRESRKPALPAEARGKAKQGPPPPPVEEEDPVAVAARMKKPALPAEARGKGKTGTASGCPSSAQPSSAVCSPRQELSETVAVTLSRKPALPLEARGRAAAIRDGAGALRHSAEGRMGGRSLASYSVSQSCQWPSARSVAAAAAAALASPSPSPSPSRFSPAPAAKASPKPTSPLALKGVEVGPDDVAIMVVPAVALLHNKPLPYDKHDWSRKAPEWGDHAPGDAAYERWLAYVASWQPTVLVRADGSVVV